MTRLEADMAWFLVVVAGLLETGFAIFLKQSHGFTRIAPTALFIIFALGSFGLLTLALRRLEVGPAYAVWTGIGAAGTAIAGMIWLSESVSAIKIASISLVVAGVIGLQLSGTGH
jgi:quaternary ammonium compound-resistance protein SugE